MSTSEFHLKCITSIIQGYTNQIICGNLVFISLNCFRLEKMSGRFDRTNFVSGIEILFDFVTYILKNNFEDQLFGDQVISEVCTHLKLYNLKV